jgi:Stress responsive A/B Barrel Domain
MGNIPARRLKCENQLKRRSVRPVAIPAYSVSTLRARLLKLPKVSNARNKRRKQPVSGDWIGHGVGSAVMFIHHVYFWLKPQTPQAAREQLAEDCRTILTKIPKVQHLWAGPPAGTTRDIVDNSYDIGLCVVLDDSAAHDVYQSHPHHLEFIARNKAHWDRVKVYDFLSESL